MKTKYRKLVANLRKACKLLKWKFSTDTDIIDRWGIDDGVAFTIDGVEYFASSVDGQRYYGAIVVQYHGNREEPPSEDEQVLKGDAVSRPEFLVMRFIDAHWLVRRQWTNEALIPEEA